MKPANKSKPKLRVVAKDGERIDDARDDDRTRLNLTPLGDIEEEDIDWLWYPYFARGELTIVEGDPGSHKSRMIQRAIRDLLDNFELPSRFTELQDDLDCAVLFDCENDGATSLRRRFRCLGLKNVDGVLLEGNPFELTVDNVDDIIGQLKPSKPGLIVFDTMNDYFARWADTHKGRDVVHALQPFKRMAKELNASVVLVRHLRKASGKALYAGQGSISYVGKARIVIAVAKDTEADVPGNVDLVRMAISKANEVRGGKALEFRVIDISTPTHDGEFKFKWGNYVDKTADDILNVPGEPGRPADKRERAKTFLLEKLKDGRMESTRLMGFAEAGKISKRTLERAGDELGVEPYQEGRKWYWELPSSDRQTGSDRQN
jgi:hypothetical protein